MLCMLEAGSCGLRVSWAAFELLEMLGILASRQGKALCRQMQASRQRACKELGRRVPSACEIGFCRYGPSLFLGDIDGTGGEEIAMKQAHCRHCLQAPELLKSNWGGRIIAP